MSLRRFNLRLSLLSAVLLACPTKAAEIAWVPLEADGDHTIIGNEIILEGGGQVVTLEIRVSDWDVDLNGDPQVGTVQATLDATGFGSGTGDSLVPLTSPTPLAGAFIALKVCHFFDGANLIPTEFRCDAPLTCPPEAPICLDNPDFIFSGFVGQAAVSTSTSNYAWGAVSNPGVCAVDNGTSRYAGTLRIVVPPLAAGTYTIGFDPDTNSTFLNNCVGTRITDLVMAPAVITVACQVDSDCQDGNACTDDECGPDSRCAFIPNFDDGVDCCDPVSGGLTPLEDGNDCTDGSCDPTTGVVTQLPSPADTICGEPPIGACDIADRCDGAGQCEVLFADEGAPCGDNADTECTDPDSCDGFGTCLNNHMVAGAPCGDPATTECSDPDTCDGGGGCDANHLPDDTDCDDGLFCTTGETCTAGSCGGGTFTCDDDVACTTDVCEEENELCINTPDDGFCDNGQFCDGIEFCDAQSGCQVQPGSVPDCDDGVSCTIDSCDEAADTCVNAPNNANCDNNLFCDGVEVCDPVLDCVVVPGSVPDCDDGIDCTVDVCNELDDRCDNLPDDTRCPDDGLFCTGVEICVPGVGCVSTGNPCGNEASCDEEADQCLCDVPIAVAAGGRYLAVSLRPADSPIPQAIVIKASCPDGVARYAGQPQPWDINNDGIPDGSLAFLVDDPADAAYLTPVQWGDPVYVAGTALVPESVYEVRADCGTSAAPGFSPPASPNPITWTWCDTDEDEHATFADVQFMVFAFQGIYMPGKQTLPNLDVRGPEFCEADQRSNFDDVQATVLAFQGMEYTDTGCPYDCPSCRPGVTCDDGNACTFDSCAIDGSCVHTLTYDPSIWCCNPSNGVLTLIDDGDPCSIDSCQPANGRVTHVLIECDDGDDCTLDRCEAGICVNTDFEMISCTDNSDCPYGSPGCTGSVCTCPGTPTARFEWQPVASTGPATILENVIAIPEGDVEITLELRLSGWAPDGLRVFQATILGDQSYLSGAAGSLSPVTDPTPSAGAFIVKKHCTPNFVDYLDSCDPGPPCPSGQFCVDNPDYVFADKASLAVTSTASIDYIWGGLLTAPQDSVIDDGTSKYCGTLILEVSPDAEGIFTLEFAPELTRSFLTTPDFQTILPLALEPASIVVGTSFGRCCYTIGQGTTQCANLTGAQCLSRPGPRVFTPGATCSADVHSGCGTCDINLDCDDGSACTNDVCRFDASCLNEPIYDDAVHCCNPADGALTVLDDLDDCTEDSCNEATGEVTHVAIPDCVPSEVCGIASGDNCKPGPDLYLLLSDRRSGTRWADDFQPNGSSISELCWWPCFYNILLGEECSASPPPDDFVVRIYEDDGGLPGAEVGPVGGQPVVPSAKERLGAAWRCWLYSASLPTPVDVTPGACYWIEITGVGSEDGCGVFLADSAQGNDYSVQNLAGGGYSAGDVIGVDMAVCLDSGLASSDDCGPVSGACCVCGQSCTDAGDSMDHVQCGAQGGIFFPGESCTGDLCAAPANDACVDSLMVTHPGADPASDIHESFDTYCATTDGPSPVPQCDGVSTPVGGDVWFRYVAPCTGEATVRLCEESRFDSVLTVYGAGTMCACPVDDTTQIACSDDACANFGGAGFVDVPVSQGDCLTIRVGGWDGDTGEGALTVSISCAP